ncbi:hypothetical protein ACSNOK_36150, partial [Streptomyces sp. URMC 126]|uniref:hypothetical protein n=1 Tax=Streptomyces sp. URMC 126 TaxID=3423401 RepID=UPI003F1CB49F
VLIAVIGVLAVGGTVLAGEIYEAVVANDGIAVFDQPILESILANRTPALTSTISVFSQSGGSLWMSIITGIAVTALCVV